MRTTIRFGILLAIVVVVCSVFAWAQPAVGVGALVLARGTYQPFKVETEVVDFEAKARWPLDMVVRQHEYAVDGTTGWHSHPGPVFITVKTGQLTFYEVDDPTCTPKIVNAGEGYVDTGHGHIARNESGAPATDVSVILAPVGQPFRTNLSANANPNCPFAF